jgi:TetR/AcrR family transcriptional regulator, lmrAB and yxaGH operons repressor
VPDTPSARARFLAATEEMLREAGVSGIGINDVVSRSGAPIGSLYHYFPGGKTQLVVEALGIHAEKSCRLFERFFDGRTTAAAALRSLFNTAADGFERAGANKGCAIGTVTLDLLESDAELRDVCRTTFERWIGAIAPQLPFADDRSRRSFAMTVVSALEGAFILGRATESGEPFRAAGKWLAASVPAGRARRVHRTSRRRI